MRIAGYALLLGLGWPAPLWGHQKPVCQTIRGRAHLYTGDGQLRIWHIGTHHEFEPDASSWNRVQGWLEEGATPAQKQQDAASVAGDVFLYGTFVVCPVEPFKKGAVQKARIESVAHRLYTPAK